MVATDEVRRSLDPERRTGLNRVKGVAAALGGRLVVIVEPAFRAARLLQGGGRAMRSR
jgi:hypothetical protein